MRSLSRPRTTKMRARPASSAVATARSRTVVPPSGKRSLLLPMRVDWPAASTTPATEGSPVMDASRLVAQVHRRASGAYREHFRDDAHGDLFRAIGREVQAHGSVETSGGRCPDLLQDLLA